MVQLKRIEDDRGFFARAWCHEEFAQNELNPNMVQLNVGFSGRQGTLRGMHYQESPHQEAKFVRCTRGAIYDVIIDLRADSPTRQSVPSAIERASVSPVISTRRASAGVGRTSRTP